MTDGELEALITEMRAKLPADAYERVEPFLQLGLERFEGGDPRQARLVFGQIIADMANLQPSVERDQAQSIAWYNIALAAGAFGNVDEEIGIYTHLVDRFGDARDPAVRYILAMSMHNKAVRLAESGHLDEAVRAFEEVVTRFIDDPEPGIRAQAAMAISAGGATRGRLGRPQDALRDYDRLITLFGGDPDPNLRRLVAMTLYGKAAVLSRLGRQEEVLLIVDELMNRFSDDPDPAIRKVIADAEESQRRFADAAMTAEPFHAQLEELIERGSLEEVYAFTDTILVGCCDPAHDALGGLVSTAMVAPALVLLRQGRLDEAMRAVGAIIHRLDDAHMPWMHLMLSVVVAKLTNALREQKRFAECIEWCDRLLSRSFVGSAEIDAAVASVLYEKATSLSLLGEKEAAVDTCAEALRRFPSVREPYLGRFVALTLFLKGVLLKELGRTEEAITALTDVSSRCGDDPQPIVRSLVLNAAAERGILLRQQGRLREAVAVWSDLIERFGDATEPDHRLEVAKVAFDRITVLREIGEYRTAIAACETYARFVDVDHPNGRRSIALARLNKGVLLRDLGRMHEAVQVCDELIADSANDTDQTLRPIVALALRNKGTILEEVAWPEAAADVYAELVARFANDNEPEILEQVTLARQWLAVLRGRENDRSATRSNGS